jgi:hypothetical protein
MTPSHREMAVKRIIQFNYHFRLPSDTCYNAVTYLDIILSTVPINVEELDLIATVCYWISAKVETRIQLAIEAINGVTGNNYTSEMFRATEMRIVTGLKFQLSYPTPKLFLRRILYRTNAPTIVFELSNLLIEILIMKFKFVDIRPSMIAAAAAALSFASTGDFASARQAIQESPCQETGLFAECVSSIAVYGQRLVAAGEKVDESSSIKGLLQQVSFDFDVNLLL